MFLYTIGFTKKSAEKFFTLIKKNGIELLIDIRLYNNTQLAGFAKGRDLTYFLRELCDCDYEHCLNYAPTKELLDNYRNKIITWQDYTREFATIMANNDAVNDFLKRFGNRDSVCLLCTEATPEQCHRRLLAEAIALRDPSIQIIHL